MTHMQNKTKVYIQAYTKWYTQSFLILNAAKKNPLSLMTGEKW